MDSTSVYKKLLCGDLKIKSVTAKSHVWDTFGIVSDNKGVECDFAACKRCNHVLSYKKNITGTSSMKKHKCSLLAGGQQVLTSATVKHLPPVVKKTPTIHLIAKTMII